VTLQGRTALLSSHVLAQVEELADKVSIIRHGRGAAGRVARPAAAPTWTRSATPASSGCWPGTRGYGPDLEKDEIAEDVGIDGGAVSAEEAAVRIVEP